MKKPLFSILAFLAGLLILAGGIVALVLNLNYEPLPHDAEYLVEIGTWAEKDAESVIWDFTEIGKGTLTTNSHLDDYAFLWSLDNEILKIETDWLYTLNNEYVYSLDRENNILTLSAGDEEFVFIGTPREETEVSE